MYTVQYSAAAAGAVAIATRDSDSDSQSSLTGALTASDALSRLQTTSAQQHLVSGMFVGVSFQHFLLK